MNKKTATTWGIALAIIMVLAGTYIFVATRESDTAPKISGEISAQGTVIAFEKTAGIGVIRGNDTDHSFFVGSRTRVYDENGKEADPSYIHKGFDVVMEGTEGNDNFLDALVVRIIKAPAILIYSPADGETVSDPTITVRGIARVFENSFMIRVRTSTTSVLFEEPVMAQGDGMGQFGEFNYSFALSKDAAINGKIYIDAFEYSAKDGAEINTASAGIYITSSQTTTVKAFFANQENSPSFVCDAVFPVERVIPYTQRVGQAALDELLKGPIGEEPSAGFVTNIPSGAKLLSLRIENGTAYADFDGTLDRGIGGSCRVTGIRAQITQTLEQFPTVRNVIISVNGNSSEALQP